MGRGGDWWWGQGCCWGWRRRQRVGDGWKSWPAWWRQSARGCQREARWISLSDHFPSLGTARGGGEGRDRDWKWTCTLAAIQTSLVAITHFHLNQSEGGYYKVCDWCHGIVIMQQLQTNPLKPVQQHQLIIWEVHKHGYTPPSDLHTSWAYGECPTQLLCQLSHSVA